MKKIIPILILLISQSLFANGNGGIVEGTVKDENNNPIPYAVVKVKDKPIGTRTDAEGKFVLNLSDTGKYELNISNLNFNPKSEVVEIVDGNSIRKEIVLTSKALQLKGAVIKAHVKKSSQAALLLEQKKAVIIEDKIGSEEMSKKGASSASAAVAKMSGVSKNSSSDIGSIFVRGLGDRYLSTTFNGLLLPSESPELKNIDLSYFPSNVIQSMAVSKTFNKNILGDFGGAGININSKFHSGDPFLQVNLGTGFNTQAVSNSIKSVGMDASGTMANPDIYTSDPNKYVYQGVNWSQITRSTPYLNNSASIQGGIMKKGSKNSLSVFGSVGYNSSYNFRSGYSAFVSTTGAKIQEYTKADKSSLEINKQAMLNAKYSNIKGHELKLVYLNVNNSSDEVKTYFGYNSDIDPDNSTYITRGVQNQNILNVIQLLGKYKLNNKITLDASAAFNEINGVQPQRITNIFINENETGRYRLSSNSAANNNLFYQNTNEKQWQAKGGAEVEINNKMNLYVGANAILKNKDFNAYQYNFKPKNTPYGQYNPTNIGDFFNEENFNNGSYEVSFFRYGNKPNSYSGSVSNLGGVADIEYKLNEKLTLFGGLKVEYIDQSVSWDVSALAAKRPNDVTNIKTIKPLPYFNAKYAVTDKSNLKFGVSKTYTLPQFKEMAPFLYESVISNSYGNPYLYASDNYNFDVKWESFPTSKEIFSANLFGKYIANPINKTLAPNSANELTYANTGDYAIVAGVELEIRKNLSNFLKLKESNNLTCGVNTSYIYSIQDLNSDKMYQETEGWVSGNFTNINASLTGASPILMNVDLTYETEAIKGIKSRATLMANYFSDRLYTIGLFGMGDNYEKGYVTMDLITNTEFSKHLSMGLSIKNILNPNVERYQESSKGNIVNSRFKNGRNASISFSYKF